MEAAAVESSVAEGYEALASGDWEAARAAFQSALAVDEFPEALDGLARALWWLRESEQAVVHRERAYSGFRRDGQLARAARIALWISREYALVWGNEAAANGWLARAERLLTDVAPGADRGWLDLARSERDLACLGRSRPGFQAAARPSSRAVRFASPGHHRCHQHRRRPAAASQSSQPTPRDRRSRGINHLGRRATAELPPQSACVPQQRSKPGVTGLSTSLLERRA